MELLEPTYFAAGLSEPYVAVDPTSGDPRSIPTYVSYAASGNVTGELVYINYGQYSDFEYVVNHLGISLAGKIGIVRYGKLYRGCKVR